MTALILLAVVLGGAEQPALTARGAFFALSVPDLEASARWYADKLGLARTSQAGPRSDMPGFVVLEGGGLIVELIHKRDSARPSVAIERTQGFTKAGAIVADFDDVVARLRRNGVAIVIGPFPPRENARANLIFKDNAGNMIQLFGDYLRK